MSWTPVIAEFTRQLLGGTTHHFDEMAITSDILPNVE
jgi:hypothetical protein